MSKITIEDMTYYYEDFYHSVFEHVNLVLDTDWKMGLIGRNGRGKTTLLKLLDRELEVSAGRIETASSIVYFPYQWDSKYTNTMDIIKENIGGLKTMELAMDRLLVQMNEETEQTMDCGRYLQLQEQYQNMGGYQAESKIYKELKDMQLDTSLLDRDFETLSGGERTSMLIIALFLRKDTFVLLDEPTNHLDEQRKRAVAAYLKRKKGFILVSHDVRFLNQVVDHILAINKSDITLEQGNYATWKKNMEQKESYELRTRQHLEEEIVQLERRAGTTRKWAETANTQKYPFASQARTNGARAYMRQTKHADVIIH